MTGPTLKVLALFLTHRTDEIAGSEIAKNTKLASGTLYPILLRLENAGWLKSKWETEDPRDLGRPRRRLYRLTGEGARSAQAAFKEISVGTGALVWQ
jgi:DNA-binding PadR family transcriptional regulator